MAASVISFFQKIKVLPKNMLVQCGCALGSADTLACVLNQLSCTNNNVCPTGKDKQCFAW